METIFDTTIEASGYHTGHIIIKQESDTIVVREGNIAGFMEGVRRCSMESGKLKDQIDEEPETTPEKWYVVLDGSNQRLTNSDRTPTIFVSYSAAYKYARGYGGEEWTHCPISADEYERAFGR